MLGRAICFAQSTDLNVAFIQNHPCRNAQNNTSPSIWAPCGPVKLTHKIKQHAPSCTSLAPSPTLGFCSNVTF
jgi:hypothetical protein